MELAGDRLQCRLMAPEYTERLGAMPSSLRNPPQPLHNLAEVASALGDEQVANEARLLAEQLVRREPNVFVVGQFKRGKSTIVNALLEEDIMPTGALPLTGIATAIRYGAQPSITVQLRGDETKQATVEELATYVSERTNPKNALGVQSVVIVRNAGLLQDITLFDTPGVGSIHEHNTEAAHSLLPRADAAILVVGPDPPIGAEELAYAEAVAGSSVQLFVVFNKADLAGDALAELLDFTRGALNRAGVENFVLFPISATLARQTQREGREDPAFAAFANAMHEFINSHGAGALEISARRRAGALLERLARLLEMRKRALELPQLEREQRRGAVEAALLALDDRVRLLALAVDDDVRNLRLRLDEALDRKHDREQSAFQSLAHEIGAVPSRDERRMLLEKAVQEKAHLWRHEAVGYAEARLREYATKYVRLLGELEEDVIRAGCEALCLDATGLEPRSIQFEPAKLSVIVSLDPSTGLEMLRDAFTDALPQALRRKVLEPWIRAVLAAELDAVRGKLRYGIAHDLEPWRKSAQKTIATTLEGARAAVLGAFPSTVASSQEESVKRRLDELERTFAEVRAALQASEAPW